MPQPLTNPAYKDYAFIAFALMGAMVKLETACRRADAALKAKGFAAGDIAQAKAEVHQRIEQWSRP